MSVDLSIDEVVAATGGELLRPGVAARVRGVATDSRSVAPGQAFFALSGDRFDGHRFCPQAAEGGAALLVVERDVEVQGPAVLEVDDCRRALGRLARAWRRSVGARTVAITGSVGKTTTKELTRALLERLGPTHCTPGNFNNDVGLPLTLLSMPAETRYLVAEMGMNAPGEIAYLTRLAEPEVGVITCVAPVHLEGLGSLEAVAAAKGELLQGLDAERAWAVVPGDEPLLALALQSVPASRRVRFGAAAGDEVQIEGVEALGQSGSRVLLTLRGEAARFDLPLVGAHNVRNAAAAAATAMVLGLSADEIAAGLAQGPAELKHRSTLIEAGGWRLFDDCYNANPVAVKAALETLVGLAGGETTVAVLGEMRELGAASARYHDELGRHCAEVGLGHLVVVGGAEVAPIAAGARAAGLAAGQLTLVNRAEEAVEAAARAAGERAWILIKASRGARLERVVEGLAGLRGVAGEDN
jgi:UDP-N-acetylmuramoyl-tripeptide--D-alanyl-D-alanine ligase